MTKKDIKAKLDEHGIEYDESSLKAELEALLPSNDPILDDEPEDESPIVTATPDGLASVNPHGGKAAIMKAKLDAQPQVAIMVPLSPGEPQGSTLPVTLNGYRLNIRKGQYVNVPQQVAQVVMESQQMDQQAIQNYFHMTDGVSQAMRDKGINQRPE